MTITRMVVSILVAPRSPMAKSLPSPTRAEEGASHRLSSRRRPTRHVATCLAALALVAGCARAARADDLATDLAHFAPRLDTNALRGKADPAFWAVVKHGKEAVPPLLEMLDDAKPIEPQAQVPKVGGPFARGDVAFEALLEIADFPWQELVPRSVKKRVGSIGNAAYFEYVRGTAGGRKQLADAMRKWWAKNGPRLVFEKMEDHPAGGYWRTPELPPG